MRRDEHFSKMIYETLKDLVKDYVEELSDEEVLELIEETKKTKGTIEKDIKILDHIYENIKETLQFTSRDFQLYYHQHHDMMREDLNYLIEAEQDKLNILESKNKRGNKKDYTQLAEVYSFNEYDKTKENKREL